MSGRKAAIGLCVLLAGVAGRTAPSFGVPTAALAVDNIVVWPGESTTVRLFVGDFGGPGIHSMAVNISVLGIGWSPDFEESYEPGPVEFVPPLDVDGLPSYPGTVQPDKSISGIAASVRQSPPLMGWGSDSPVEALHFTVYSAVPGFVTLGITNFIGLGYQGIVNWSKQVGDPGGYAAVRIYWMPEPASLGLLAGC